MGTLSPQTTHISAPQFAPAAPSESQCFDQREPRTEIKKRQVQSEDVKMNSRLTCVSPHAQCVEVGRQLCLNIVKLLLKAFL